MRANEACSEAKRQFSARNRDVLMNAQSPHKWWSTLKSAVFGLSSSLPPLVGEGDGLVCESVGKANVLSDDFDGKLPLTCHASPRLTSFTFRSSEVGRLLLDLDPYGGSGPLGMFPFFLREQLGSFPDCWRQANITPIQKGPPSSSVANYRPISITSALSKVFERLVSVHLGRFMEHSDVLPTTQFAYRVWVPSCDALLCMSHTLKSVLESRQEAMIVQIAFSAAFDKG